MKGPGSRSFRRIVGTIAGAVVAALIAVPAAYAAGPLGSLSQLPSPNNCVGTTPECGTASTSSLTESQDVVVSPDGKNVYVVEFGDDSISEFARHSDGSLTQLASPNNCIAQTGSTSTCGTKTANGLQFAEALAISPDGKNVYAVGEDSSSVGAVAEFARNADGSLTQLASPDNCIGENSTQTDGTLSTCGTSTGHGLFNPVAVTVSPDGSSVYVADRAGSAIAEFARNGNGSLTQLSGANDCVQEHGTNNGFGPDCTTTGNGLSNADSLTVSPDGHNIYVGGNDSIAEFTRNADGSLTQLSGANNCIQNAADQATDCGNETGIGLLALVSVDVSPDGHNLYSSAGNYTGAVGEFARNADGSLTQLGGANSCIEENAANEGSQPAAGCGTNTGHGLGEGGALQVSPDGANVYVAESSDDCNSTCHSAVVEFSRRADGSLIQLASPNNCIEEQGGADCGNETGRGLSTNVLAGLAIAPGADSVYTGGKRPSRSLLGRSPPLPSRLAGPGAEPSRMGPARSHARRPVRTPTRLGARSR